MALNQFGAGFTLTGRDMASPAVKRVQTSFMGLQRSVQSGAAGMNKALGSLAIGFGAMKLGAGMAGMAKASADAAGQFEQGLAGIAAVSRATSDEQLALHDKALKSAMSSQYSPDEAVEGLTNLATAGLKAKEQIEVLDPVLNLAAGSMGQLGMGDAANAVVGTIKSMGYETGRATEVTDKLLKITQLTNFQTRDFSIGLSRATSTAKLYDQSLNDTLIQMGLLRNMNIEASVASTSLRESWRRLATDQKAQQAVQERGVKIFDEETNEIRPLLNVMSDLAAQTTDLNDKERMRMATTAFGVRGMAAFNAVAEARQTFMVNGIKVTLEGIDAINAMRMEMMAQGEVMDENAKKSLQAALGIEDLDEALKSSTGTAEAFKDTLLDTYEGQKKLIEGAKEALTVVTGEAAAQLFKPVATVLFNITAGMAELMNSIPPGARKLIIGVVTAIGSLVAMAGGVLVLQGAMNMLGLSFGGIVITMAKFLLVAAPVMVLMGGLAVGVYALWRAFSKDAGGIGTSWQEMVDKITVGWKVMMAVVKGEPISKELDKQIKETGLEGFLRKFTNFGERMQSLWEGIKQGFEIGVQALADSPAFARLKETIGGVLELFTGTEMENSQDALDSWEERGKAAGLRLASLGEIAADVLVKLIELGKGFVEFAGNLEASDIEAGIHGFVDTFRLLADILSTVKTAFMGIYQAVKLVVVALAEALLYVANLLTAIVQLPFNLGSDEQFDIWKNWYKKQLSPDFAFQYTTGTAGDLAGVFTDEADRMADRDNADAGRGRREVDAENRMRQISGLRERKRAIEEWANLSASEWAERTKGTAAEGGAAFEDASLETQRKYILELEKVARSIERLSKQPVSVNIDGEKAAEILGRTPSFTGEDSLDDTLGVEIP